MKRFIVFRYLLHDGGFWCDCIADCSTIKQMEKLEENDDKYADCYYILDTKSRKLYSDERIGSRDKKTFERVIRELKEGLK